MSWSSSEIQNLYTPKNHGWDLKSLVETGDPNPNPWQNNRVVNPLYLGVSKNNGTPKSRISIGFSIIFTIHFGG